MTGDRVHVTISTARYLMKRLPTTIILVCGVIASGQCALAQNRHAMDAARNKMVDEEIAGAGIQDPRVIQSLRDTPRHEFVPVGERKNAYYDMALPIGEGQTISPPFFVAYMTEQLQPLPEDRVLEIGTGSGFQSAVLSPLVKDVYSIEIKKTLGERAARALKRLKYANVHTKIDDGYLGWPEHAPFDKIIVTCSPESPPQALIDQLKEGGRMLIPLGERYQQTLYLFTKVDGELHREPLAPTLFVPMTGEAEEQRVVKPDPLHPAVYNGGFEEIATINEVTRPIGWHYLRQMKVVTSDDAPEGESYITFTNLVPGRRSHALQALPIDGRVVHEVKLSLLVRLQRVQPGTSPDELPVFAVTFYDERRAMIKTLGVGPWRGSSGWEEATKTIQVPSRAREAFIRVGLFGAVGEASFDQLEVKVVKRKDEG
jgi:protein-L-isoaspartate(D-aspartate) O-methyltransferase